MIGPNKSSNMVVHLIGVTRYHHDAFKHIEEELTKQDYIVFKPVFYDPTIYEQYKDIITKQCYNKLTIADFVLLVTPEYIGKSTQETIDKAKELHIPIMIWDWKHDKMIAWMG